MQNTAINKHEKNEGLVYTNRTESSLLDDKNKEQGYQKIKFLLPYFCQVCVGQSTNYFYPVPGSYFDYPPGWSWMI